MKRLQARIFHHGQAGLTLPELLVVLIILAILLASAVQSIHGFRTRAADAAAGASLREALPSILAYYSDNRTYLGMTPAGLRSSYDAGIAPSLALADLAADDYCAQTTISGRTWSQDGPGGSIELGSC
jgi:prepilin-type N-terminal cleavage/methylation domain-containing protein